MSGDTTLSKSRLPAVSRTAISIECLNRLNTSGVRPEISTNRNFWGSAKNSVSNRYPSNDRESPGNPWSSGSNPPGTIQLRGRTTGDGSSGPVESTTLTVRVSSSSYSSAMDCPASACKWSRREPSGICAMATSFESVSIRVENTSTTPAGGTTGSRKGGPLRRASVIWSGQR